MLCVRKTHPLPHMESSWLSSRFSAPAHQHQNGSVYDFSSPRALPIHDDISGRMKVRTEVVRSQGLEHLLTG